MLIALLSDIHANYAALKRVQEDIQTQVPQAYQGRDVNLIWCLGDLIGRGPQPLECIALFQEWERQVEIKYLAGNHEALYFGTERKEAANQVANAAIEAQRPLIAEQSRWLRQRFTDQRLPTHDHSNTHWFFTDQHGQEQRILRLRDTQLDLPIQLLLCHGTWFYQEAFEYLWPHNWWSSSAVSKQKRNQHHIVRHMEMLANEFSADTSTVLVCGHTHVPMGFTASRQTPNQPTAYNLAPNEQVDLADELYLFNAGSVGHSRIGPVSQTRYLLLDCDNVTIEQRTISYHPRQLERALVRTYGRRTDTFRELKTYFFSPPKPSHYT